MLSFGGNDGGLSPGNAASGGRRAYRALAIKAKLLPGLKRGNLIKAPFYRARKCRRDNNLNAIAKRRHRYHAGADPFSGYFERLIGGAVIRANGIWRRKHRHREAANKRVAVNNPTPAIVAKRQCIRRQLASISISTGE